MGNHTLGHRWGFGAHRIAAIASEKLIKKVDALGCKAIMFTVDSARSGFRELDVRAKGVVEAPPPSAADDKSEKTAKGPVGIAQAISGYQDPNLTWDDMKFIRVSVADPHCVRRTPMLTGYTS